MKIKRQHWDATDKSSHYDAIKFVATFLVVLAHASRMYTGTGVVIPYNASDGLNHLTNIIYSFHMPLYMSVSGMVYALCIHDYQKYQDTARFLKNKAIRLLIPYLFFGICYVAPVMCLLGFTDQSYLRYCWDGIVLAHNNRHLWYILALFDVCRVRRSQSCGGKHDAAWFAYRRKDFAASDCVRPHHCAAACRFP